MEKMKTIQMNDNAMKAVWSLVAAQVGPIDVVNRETIDALRDALGKAAMAYVWLLSDLGTNPILIRANGEEVARVELGNDLSGELLFSFARQLMQRPYR